MWEDAGQLMPMGMAMAWALARISLYNWPLTCATTLALLAATSFALLRVLRTLFGNRPAILLPLTMFLFSPLQLSISWWSMVINILPVELAICMAVDEHVRYLRTGRMRNAVAAAGWLLAGMAACDKGAVVPLLLFGLTSAFFAAGLWAPAMVTALVRYWRAWLLYGVVLAAWAVVYVIQLSSSGIRPGDPDPGANTLDRYQTGASADPDIQHINVPDRCPRRVGTRSLATSISRHRSIVTTVVAPFREPTTPSWAYSLAKPLRWPKIGRHHHYQ